MSDLLARNAAIAVVQTFGQTPLACNSKVAAVAILKTSTTLDVGTRMVLTPWLVGGIISAEAKRLGRLEWLGESMVPYDDLIPIDLLRRTGGQGPGQLYPQIYTDVTSRLKPELDEFLAHMGVNCGAGVPLFLKGYPGDVIDPITADFFIASALALRVNLAMKSGRPWDDQLQFGIGLYFGAFKRISNEQKAISPRDQGASVLRYPPVRDYLLRSSDENDRDVANYIQEVFGRR